MHKKRRDELIMTIELLLAAIEDETQRSFAERLYLDHRQLMVSIAYRILGTQQEAEDVMMTMMVKFINNVEYYMQCPEDKLVALVVVCTRNAAIDAWRKRKVREKREMKLGTTDDEGNEISGDIEDVSTNIENLVINGESISMMRKALMRLKEKDREIMKLRVYHGLPSKTVAEMLNISVNAVDLRLKKARVRLMDVMNEIKKEEMKNG